jgi:hypothetical protein
MTTLIFILLGVLIIALCVIIYKQKVDIANYKSLSRAQMRDFVEIKNLLTSGTTKGWNSGTDYGSAICDEIYKLKNK